jgi:hypothetical protein
MQSEEHRPSAGEPSKSDGAFAMPKWVVLLPVSVDVASVMREPAEPQLTLRSVVAKALPVVGRLGLRLPIVGHLRAAGPPRDGSDDGG